MTPFSERCVHDIAALDEIELYGELIIAASTSDGPLTQDEIDAVLGVPAARTITPRSRRARSGRGGRSPARLP